MIESGSADIVCLDVLIMDMSPAEAVKEFLNEKEIEEC